MSTMTREKYQEIVDLTETSELKGKNMLYTSTNGYMYSTLNKDGQLGIRLSKEDQQKFDEKYGAKPFHSYNAKMRDYVLIDKELSEDQKVVAAWLTRAHNYVTTLKPK